MVSLFSSRNARENSSAADGGGFRRNLGFLCWEAGFAFALEAWVGPVYLTAIAGELHVPVWMVTLLSAAAFIGAVGQIAGLWFLSRGGSLKGYTLTVASAARAIWILPLFLALFWHFFPPHGGFPQQAWFGVTALVACGYGLLASSSAGAWQSWMNAIVPSRFRGRFFGARQRALMAAMIGAHLLAALLIDWKPRGLYAGAWVLGTFAVMSAVLSTWLLSRVSGPTGPAGLERSDEPSESLDSTPSPSESLVQALLDREFRPILAFGTAFNGALMLAGNYFPYFFTREVGVPMSQVAVWFLLSNLGSILAAGFWGRRIDVSGDPLSTLKITSFFVALSPLPYVLGSAAWIRAIGPFEYFWNGCMSSGFQLAMTALLFRAVPRERNLAYFSVYMAATGLAGATGSVVGGVLAESLASVGGFRALWVIAALARAMVVLVAFGTQTAWVRQRRIVA